MLFVTFSCFPISFYTQKLSLQRESYDFCVSRNVMLTDFSGLEQGNTCFFGFSYLVSDKISQNISETKGFWISCFPWTRNVPGAPGKSYLLRFSYFVLFGIVWNHCESKQFSCFLVSNMCQDACNTKDKLCFPYFILDPDGKIYMKHIVFVRLSRF